jgi:hypothetical protein
VAHWRKTVNIKAVLNDGTLTEGEQAQAVVKLLSAHAEFREHDDGLTLEELQDAADAVAIEGWERFDRVLFEVYNVADAERIFTGL